VDPLREHNASLKAEVERLAPALDTLKAQDRQRHLKATFAAI